MKTYIATFYSHFGAIQFSRICKENNISSKMMPVPRKLSSSCGSCVQYESDMAYPGDMPSSDIEQIVIVEESQFRQVYMATDN